MEGTKVGGVVSMVEILADIRNLNVTGYPLTDIGWYLLKNRPCTSLLLQLYLWIKRLFAELKGDKDYRVGGKVILLRTL